MPITPSKCLLPSDVVLILVPANIRNAFSNSGFLTISHVFVGLDEWCIDSEGEVTAVINGFIPNAYRPIAIGSPCVVPLVILVLLSL